MIFYKAREELRMWTFEGFQDSQQYQAVEKSESLEESQAELRITYKYG